MPSTSKNHLASNAKRYRVAKLPTLPASPLQVFSPSVAVHPEHPRADLELQVYRTQEINMNGEMDNFPLAEEMSGLPTQRV